MQDRFELYGAAAARELDRRLIEAGGVDGYALMCQAAAACWKALQQRWPRATRLAVLCGSGNNGGDGYELARLARAAACRVTVIAVSSREPGGEAARARQAWLDDGGSCQAWNDSTALADDVDVVVDAIFGTGLSRAPAGSAAAAIDAINSRHADGIGVLAVDVPSGLDVNRGVAPGVCVKADASVTFIGRKFGLHTGVGPDFAGDVIYAPLVDLPAGIDAPAALGRLAHASDLASYLPRRRRSAHKGDHGHVLIVGGDQGMAGAALLAARAALRAGAGLVSVATRAAHATLLAAAQPEVMFHGVESTAELQALLARAEVVAVGPGLGQGAWGRALWAALDRVERLVVDADALNLLAQAPRRGREWILTPHPGEAARLLACATGEVLGDRLASLQALAERYGGFPLLKGAGTLVHMRDEVSVCPYGNPGMGVGGMGDVLTGIIAAGCAQGLEPPAAAAWGVLAHALAGDAAAAAGERGLLPSDLIAQLRAVLNP